jgi:hypothetical protein
MEKNLELFDEIWESEKKLDTEPLCSRCESGHTVAWFHVPPPECPYCNAAILPDRSPCV